MLNKAMPRRHLHAPFLAGLLFLLAAFAEPPPRHPGIEEYLATADRFERLAAQSATPPRLTDPAAGPLLRRLTDSRATFGSARFTIDDLEPVETIMQRTYAIVVRYAHHGLASGVAAAEATRLEDENSILFQDEIMPFVAFSIEVIGIVARAVREDDGSDDPIAATPEGRRQLLAVRQTLEGTVGDLTMAADPRLRPANRMVLLEAYARHAPAISASLTLPQRRRLHGALEPLRPAFSPEARARLDEILEALAATTCEGLCAL